MPTYRETCPQRTVVKAHHTTQTWLPVDLDCGHRESINWTVQPGDKVGCIACEQARKLTGKVVNPATGNVLGSFVRETEDGARTLAHEMAIMCNLGIVEIHHEGGIITIDRDPSEYAS